MTHKNRQVKQVIERLMQSPKTTKRSHAPPPQQGYVPPSVMNKKPDSHKMIRFRYRSHRNQK